MHCIVGVRTDDALDLHELVRLCSALSAENSEIQQAAEEISSGALRDDSAERGLVLVEHDHTRHVAPGEERGSETDTGCAFGGAPVQIFHADAAHEVRDAVTPSSSPQKSTRRNTPNVAEASGSPTGTAQASASASWSIP